MIFKFEPATEAQEGDFLNLAGAIEEYLEAQAVPATATAQLMIAFDELISNVLNHGAPPQLEVSVAVEGSCVRAEVADNGAAFDPLELPEPDTGLSVEEREMGGLGVHIVRNLMDDVSYVRDSEWNRLRFSKTFAVE